MDGNTTVKYLQNYLRQKDLGFLALDSLPQAPAGGPGGAVEAQFFPQVGGRGGGGLPRQSFTVSFGAQGSR